jgi:hypothetical protein
MLQAQLRVSVAQVVGVMEQLHHHHHKQIQVIEILVAVAVAVAIVPEYLVGVEMVVQVL